MNESMNEFEDPGKSGCGRNAQHLLSGYGIKNCFDYVRILLHGVGPFGKQRSVNATACCCHASSSQNATNFPGYPLAHLWRTGIKHTCGTA